MSLQVQRIREARRFMGLAGAWSRLATESGRTSPFLSHDWFWCCWHAVWPGRRPEILLVEEAGHPVAVIPLMTWTEWVHALPVRCLGFLDVSHAPNSDILSVADPQAVVGALLEHLGNRAGWDVLRLGKLPVASPTLLVLRQALSRGRYSWRATTTPSHYLTIKERPASGPQRSTSAAGGDTAERRSDTVSVEEHRTIDPGGALFQEALTLTRRSSARQPLVEPRMPEFLGQLMRRGSRLGWFSLWALKFRARLIGVEYQIRADDRVYGLQTHIADAPPGFAAADTLRREIIALLIRAGVREYHFRPVEGEQHGPAVHQEAIELTLFRSHLYSRLLQGVEATVTPLVRAWREITPSTSRAAAGE